jgi:3-oxoacyl-[acyl-carrier-protein] synthase II
VRNPDEDHAMGRVVVTGIGIVSPIGIGVDEFWRSAMAGRSGVREIVGFDASSFSTTFAGEVHGFDSSRFLPRAKARRMSAAAEYAFVASMLALDDAALRLDEVDRDDVGIALGVSMTGMDFIEPQAVRLQEQGPQAVSPFLAVSTYPGAAASNVSVELGIHGETVTMATGCSSATNAIGYAFKSISHGDHTVMITGGAEKCVTPLVMAAFSRARALSCRNSSPGAASRPFDRFRDGFVLGDGAAILVLEDLVEAERRGARVYAEIIGYGSTSDGYSMVGLEETGQKAVGAVAKAFKDSGRSPSDVDYVCAHGSSSVASDKRETRVIKKCLGSHARRTAVSSVKSMIGHPLGACGGFQTAVCALSIKEGLIPPTINYEEKDPDCDLDYVPNEGRDKTIDVAMNVSLGMGGNNACIAMGSLQ